MSSLIAIRFPDGDTQDRHVSLKPEVGATLIVSGRQWTIVSVDAEERGCRVEARRHAFQWYEGVPPRAPGRDR
jgi:hypothetical protein